MTNQIALWESAADAFTSRYEAVNESNSNLPTPCPDFDVAALVEHATGTQRAFAGFFGGVVAEAADFPSAIETIRSALAIPGAIDGEAEHPNLGSMPKEALLAIATNDMAIHAWDLSQALGLDESLPAANIDAAIAGLRSFPAEVKPFVFAGTQEPEADASPMDQMLALAGRTRM